jgi:DNA (cytosine-5)-methyltransferase 1
LPFSPIKDWILGLPKLPAGGVNLGDPDHCATQLSAVNLKRIQMTPEGGGRRDWPDYLKLNCHSDHTGHTDVYGRLAYDNLSSTLTTRCCSYSNGRFGHPTEDRAISVREAACIQTFPRHFTFTGSITSKARQIGNAVPPLLPKTIGQYFKYFLL